MNFTQFLGVLAFVTGSALALGKLWIADSWLQQTTGMTWDALRPYAGLLLILGLVALGVEALTSTDGRHRLKHGTRRWVYDHKHKEGDHGG
jgi:hypothetical protein